MRFSRKVILAIASGAVIASVVSFVAPSAYAAWTASAAGTFTQSVPSAAPSGIGAYLTCTTDLNTQSATLTWTAAPATFDGLPFYQYYIEWIYSSGSANGTTILTAARAQAYATPTSTNLTGNQIIRVTAEYGTASNIWKSAVSSNYAFTVSTNGNKSPVCSPEKTS